MSSDAEPQPEPPLSSREELLREIERVETRLESVRVEADASSRLATLGLLAATIAHELRNVLTPVLSYAQLARSRPNDRALVEKSLGKIVNGLETAEQILDSTLAEARESGGGEPRTSDVHAVVERALDSAQIELDRKGVAVRTDVPAGLMTAMPPHQLQQVLVNLILNSVAAMTTSTTEEGGADGATDAREITITANALRGGDRVRIEVCDTGPGFAPEIATHVFDPFVTSRGPDGSTETDGKRADRGCGLGLAICKRLVDKAGGSISVGGRPEGGAVVSIHLPAAQRQSLKKAG